jgi:hypothetical protein
MFIRGLMKTFVVKTVLGSVLTIKATRYEIPKEGSVLAFVEVALDAGNKPIALIPINQIEYCYEVDSATVQDSKD